MGVLTERSTLQGELTGGSTMDGSVDRKKYPWVGVLTGRSTMGGSVDRKESLQLQQQR